MPEPGLERRGGAPGGPHLRLRAGGLSARIDPVGAAVADLRDGDRPLLLGYGEHEPRPAFAGSTLVPWPNRVADGRYDFDGSSFSLPVNETEPGRHHALHGLVDAIRAEVVTEADDQVVLDLHVPAGPGYPSALQVRVDHRLDEEGLHTTLTSRNTGDRPVPYGVGTHPYLVAGVGPLSQWRLEAPLRTVAELDERLLPTGATSAVAGSPLDFTSAPVLGDTEVDHAFTDAVPGPDGLVTVRLLAADGGGTAISADHGWARWWQVFTSDAVPGPRHRAAVAVEPMSCPGNAFRSGTDLVVLGPGEQHTATWRISPVRVGPAGRSAQPRS